MKYLFALLFLMTTSASADPIDAIYRCVSNYYTELQVKVVSIDQSGAVRVSDWTLIDTFSASACETIADRLNSK